MWDPSTVCHEFLAQREENDFVLYYFAHQRIWELFPEKARENARPRLMPQRRGQEEAP